MKENTFKLPTISKYLALDHSEQTRIVYKSLAHSDATRKLLTKIRGEKKK